MPDVIGNRVAAVGLALVLVAGACQSGALAGPPASRAFQMGTRPLATLDPARASQPDERLVASQLFDGLVRYDDTTAAVVPDVATSWTINAGHTVFTFHLRPKSRFSDGEYVIADSFVRGLTRALSPATSHGSASPGNDLAGIVGAAEVLSGRASVLTGVRAVDPFTLEIRLTVPDPEFLVRCGDVAFSPLPSDAAMAARRPSWDVFPLGNGPFRLAGPLVAGQPVTLVPNAVHAGGRPKVAQVVLRPYDGLADEYAAWRAGQIDWSAFPPDKTAEVRHLYRPSSLVRPTAGLDALVLPTAAPGNLLFRQALSLSVDRTGIGRFVLGDALLPATGLVPPLIPGSSAGSPIPACPACTYDPVRARQLLAQSGVQVAGVFPIYFAPGTDQEAWVRAVAGDIASALGIDARATPLAAGSGAPVGAAAVSRPMRYPTPDDFLRPPLAGSGPGSAAGSTDPVFEALVAAAPTVSDPGARAERYQRAERLALASLPAIPLFWQRSFRMFRAKGWKGLGMDAFGNPTLRTLAPR